ncbi:TetR/AcrR family transcriptional regulator [Actinomadura sp. HBU206391]|nr:TetR/AcrR family transcriptional regulator [Actinomadura sp. HBU206391]
MSAEQRRTMIVAAALPLVAEHGTTVTTSQIAKAAGIGEATIFRVFTDKEELLDACVVEALRPDHVLDGIAAIPLDQPLADRLAEAAETMQAFLTRMGTVLGALHATGRHTRGRPEGAPAPGLNRDAGIEQTREALADLFEPERDSLRLPPERLAALFQHLMFAGMRRVPGTAESGVDTEALIDVFLHGALTGPGEAR